MRRATPWLVMAAALFAMTAHAVTVRITDEDGARVQVSLHPGDVLRVDLEAAPVTGRTWSVHGHVPSQLMELGATQRVFGGRMSNQGRSSFAWRAIAEGAGQLTIIYGTAVSRAAVPEKTLTISLTVAGEPLGPEEAHPPAMSQMEQTAAYERKEPCGDCSGITERLDLYRAPGETPYMLWRTYKDAPGGALTSVMTGTWTTGKGAADPTSTVYALTSTQETSFFRLDGERLIPLDAQQIPIPSPPGMDTAFHKIQIP